jgi:hypothetical protein
LQGTKTTKHYLFVLCSIKQKQENKNLTALPNTTRQLLSFAFSPFHAIFVLIYIFPSFGQGLGMSCSPLDRPSQTTGQIY